jgi:quercetin dioxygenase-like cupin family protein
MHLKCVTLLFPFILANVAAAQKEPVPVNEETHHKLVLKNEFVEVTHVTLAPDERTLYHTHSHDRAAIELSNASLAQQKMGDVEGEAGPTHPGELSLSTAVPGGYSHRVHNMGPGNFEVLDVEFLQRPEKPAQESVTGPLAGENPSARAYHWSLAPGAKTPEHTHKRPYLIVAATPMQLKMSAPDGQVMSHAVKAGDVHWVDSAVTHVLGNDSTTPGEIVELELK